MKVLDTYQPRSEGQPMTNERTYEDVNEIDPMSGPEGHGGTPDTYQEHRGDPWITNRATHTMKRASEIILAKWWRRI